MKQFHFYSVHMALSPTPPASTRNADRALATYGEHAAAWFEGTWRSDPLADDFASDLRTLGHRRGMASLTEAIAHGVHSVADAPASLQALFAELDAVPEWLEQDRLDRAGDHLTRHSAQLGLALGTVSLMNGYAHPAAAKPLILTGRYVDNAAVRTLEVGDWLREITTCGGLRRTGLGFERTVRVRVIHALVRQHLSAADAWDHEDLGVPICQSYMSFTLSEFGYLALGAMRRLGVRYTPDELDDIYHLWKYVGHLSGVCPELLPDGEADQARQAELYRLTRPAADRDSLALVHGLFGDFLVPEVAAMLPSRLAVLRGASPSITAGLIRGLAGDLLADELKLPASRFKHVVPVIGAATALAYALEEVLPGAKERRLQRGRRNRDAQETRLRAAHSMTHDLVDAAPDAQQHPAAR